MTSILTAAVAEVASGAHGAHVSARGNMSAVTMLQAQGRAGSFLFAMQQQSDSALDAVKTFQAASHLLARSLPQVMGGALLPRP